MFFCPVFEYDHITPEESEAAITLDKQLQVYLKEYFSKRVTDGEVGQRLGDVQDDGLVPVEEYDNSEYEDEKIDLSSLPF